MSGLPVQRHGTRMRLSEYTRIRPYACACLHIRVCDHKSHMSLQFGLHVRVCLHATGELLACCLSLRLSPSFVRRSRRNARRVRARFLPASSLPFLSLPLAFLSAAFAGAPEVALCCNIRGSHADDERLLSEKSIEWPSLVSAAMQTMNTNAEPTKRQRQSTSSGTRFQRGRRWASASLLHDDDGTRQGIGILTPDITSAA
jgi:hypothetical protein